MTSNKGYQRKDPNDLITRGSYTPTPLGRTLFVGLRAIDPLIQYSILSQHAGISWIPGTFGGALLPTTGTEPVLHPASMGTLFSLPPYQSVLLCMIVGSMLKQNEWLLAVSRDEMPARSAVLVALVNTVFNGLNSSLALWTLTSVNPNASTLSELLRSPYVAVGLAFYLIGIVTETISEIQRRNFKRDGRKMGKPYAGGLFSLARHINYTAHSLWRAGFAMVVAGPAWAVVVGGYFVYVFSTRAIPILDRYCSGRVSLSSAFVCLQTSERLTCEILVWGGLAECQTNSAERFVSRHLLRA